MTVSDVPDQQVALPQESSPVDSITGTVAPVFKEDMAPEPVSEVPPEAAAPGLSEEVLQKVSGFDAITQDEGLMSIINEYLSGRRGEIPQEVDPAVVNQAPATMSTADMSVDDRIAHLENLVKQGVQEIGQYRSVTKELYLREFGRENAPFDIMMHCPAAETVDDIRRLEDMGITDLQVTPWSERILAEMGVGAIMQQQPSLAVKQQAIERYAEEVISKF